MEGGASRKRARGAGGDEVAGDGEPPKRVRAAAEAAGEVFNESPEPSAAGKEDDPQSVRVQLAVFDVDTQSGVENMLTLCKGLPASACKTTKLTAKAFACKARLDGKIRGGNVPNDTKFAVCPRCGYFNPWTKESRLECPSCCPPPRLPRPEPRTRGFYSSLEGFVDESEGEGEQGDGEGESEDSESENKIDEDQVGSEDEGYGVPDDETHVRVQNEGAMAYRIGAFRRFGTEDCDVTEEEFEGARARAQAIAEAERQAEEAQKAAEQFELQSRRRRIDATAVAAEKVWRGAGAGAGGGASADAGGGAGVPQRRIVPQLVHGGAGAGVGPSENDLTAALSEALSAFVSRHGKAYAEGYVEGLFRAL